jgi:hypothetical protein
MEREKEYEAWNVAVDGVLSHNLVIRRLQLHTVRKKNQERNLLGDARVELCTSCFQSNVAARVSYHEYISFNLTLKPRSDTARQGTSARLSHWQVWW